MQRSSFLITGILVGTLVAVAQSVRGEGLLEPVLQWEKSFDTEIVAAEVDEEHFRETRDMASSLKWLMFTNRKLYLLDGKGGAVPRSEYAHVQRVTPNGRYFTVHRPVDSKVYDYVLYDWNGKTILKVREALRNLLIRNDGSSVMPMIEYGLEGGGSESVLGARFFSKDGILQSKYEFPEERLKLGSHAVAISDSYFVMYVITPRYNEEIYVFDSKGRLSWKHELEKEKAVPEEYVMKPGGSFVRLFSAGVSSNGGVIVARDKVPGYDSVEVYAFDEEGILRNRFLFGPASKPWYVWTFGDLAFMNTQHTHGLPSFLLGYDLKNMTRRFLLKEESAFFDHIDVSIEEGLMALVLGSDEESYHVSICDLDGAHITDLPLKVRAVDPYWIKLLPEALLVAEGKSLKLYSLQEGRLE